MRFFDRDRGHDAPRPEGVLVVRFAYDQELEPGQWRVRGHEVFVHCPGCATRVLEVLANDPAPAPPPEPEHEPPPPDLFQRRADGWPLCPVCGEDELYSLFLPLTEEDHKSENYFAEEMRCYRCPSVRIPPGEATPPEGLP